MDIQVIQQVDTARDKLLKDMKRTKGVRFNAAKRIEETDRKRTSNTAYASAAVVVLTLLPVFFPMPQWMENTVALTTIAFSIFILASSLLQSSHAGPVKADQFQRCALEVNSLRRELLSQPVEATNVATFSTRYDEILRRYNINHDAVDYDRYRLEHPDEFPSVAPEETESARKAVKGTDKLLDKLSAAIAAITFVLAGLAAASPFISNAINGFFRLIGWQ
ncbi:hypothetical protein Rleg2_2430 [Rhizobium leguminosarum bv. trifolii WSM2304]|uniref:SMODS and SLOG-associating 2TM effector domain-containing protein n=1 Tax=Rhizobium leguminosarum bv. trifolii (strain WSM2304) TaxID=395492 RepID=A0ABF7QNJ0_RHILW|nr:SLATT domain-containing protein [Rhizobium leguminosarum]ACI55704.1 hypothetical protein Rleg2_2430 [Rhizobium leguminosarum bv. trifolii WSM2304]